jgi:hypothetical protein
MKNRILTLLLLSNLFVIVNTNKSYSQREIRSLNTQKPSISDQNNPELPSKNITIYDGATISQEKLTNYAQEVFLNCPQYVNNDLMPIYRSQIARVQILEHSSKIDENLQSLGQVIVKNKCNPSLIADNASISIEKFNPLKYFFNYSSSEPIEYRIPNTKYTILISPAK